MGRPLAATATLATMLVALLATAGCGADPDAGGLGAAAATSTCLKDASPVRSTPTGYPADFPYPGGTVVYHVEDRGADGIIATGITATPFHDVLAAMNAASSAGYKVTSGETEENDAEANWTGHGMTGRWAIKRSATCPGQTTIQLLSKKG